jgi:hypothetical protein
MYTILQGYTKYMKRNVYKIRRMIAALLVLASAAVLLLSHPDLQQSVIPPDTSSQGRDAAEVLNELAVKGRAPKTNYSREQFGNGWASSSGCDTRNIILHRDMSDVAVNDKCEVQSGVLSDPYTGQTIYFQRGAGTSQAVQVDHVVALSDAWQKGAQQLTYERRVELANDPLELLAADGPANQQKGASDAATWLPSNKSFRCQYVARQVAVKKKYDLWVTQAEKDAIIRVLGTCSGQKIP